MADSTAAAQNRARMPYTAALIDEVRKTFPGATVQWAREGGVEVGRKAATDGMAVQLAGASPQMEKFLQVLRKEFFRIFHRAARSGDAEWGIYLSEQGAKRWDEFCGRKPIADSERS